ncbi:MAG: hypothetical protein L6R38_009574, partial [Xanthoria sp. 2 TBL-2021]
MTKHDEYESPLAHRYASREIKRIFSPRERASTWRKLWLWLAEAEKEIGLTQITDKALEGLRSNLVVSDEAYQVIAEEERIRRHDAMSHIFALEKDAPDAAGIIHIGATSCYATQTGSSAMAFKSNPMRSERICSLGRKLSNISTNFSATFSSRHPPNRHPGDVPPNRALLILLDDVTNGIVVFPAMIRSQLEEELPFMATENFIMKLVHKGISRQDAHERIRVLSRQTVETMKTQGTKNDLIERIKKDNFFKPIWDDLDGMLDPKLFIGRSAEIVEKYCGSSGPLMGKLEKYRDYINSTAT